MSFATVGALWWLAPLGGLIVLLYLLRMRRRDLKVPASFLWPPMTTEVRANALIQKLRFNWLMVLQLLALACVVFALARPQARQEGLAGQVTVVVLDVSASMNTRESGGTRYELALAELRKIIDTVGQADRLSVIEAGPVPRVVFPLSSEQSRMQRALSTVSPTDAPSDMGEALRLAASICSRQPKARIVLLSDGVFAPVRNFSPGTATLDYRKLGSSRENLSAAAFGVSPGPDGSQAYLAIQNHGLNPSEAVVDVKADGKLMNSYKVSIAAGKSDGRTFDVPSGARVLEARINAQDALLSDNYAVALTDPSSSLRVLIVGKTDPFVERALVLDPRLTVDKASNVPEAARNASASRPAYDLVVFDGVDEQPVSTRGVLVLGGSSLSPDIKAGGTDSKPTLVAVDDANPVMRSADLTTMFVDSARKLTIGSSARAAATGSSGVWVATQDGTPRRIVVAFEPLNSDFPLQVAFPIFMSNAVEFLVPRGSRSDAVSVAPGRPVGFPAIGAEATMEVRKPDGERDRVDATNGSFVLRDIKRIGAYDVSVGSTKRRIFASLVGDEESDITPRDQIWVGNIALKSSGTTNRWVDFWRPLALVAMLLLCVEWVVFMRRS